LSDVAEVKLESGASYIYRENSQRFVPLKYSVRGRDLGSTVAQAQCHLAQTVPLPQGYRMEWTGEYGAMVEAQKRLAFIVPLSLLLVMMLLYGLFNSIRDSLIALSGIPFAVRAEFWASMLRASTPASRPPSDSSRCSVSRRWTVFSWYPTCAAGSRKGGVVKTQLSTQVKHGCGRYL